MTRERFFEKLRPLTGSELAEAAGAKLVRGDAATVCDSVAPLERAAASSVTFVADKGAAPGPGARLEGLCLTNAQLVDAIDADVVLVAEDPRRAFRRACLALHRERRIGEVAGAPVISECATVHPTAVVGAGAEIGGQVEIGPNAVIGPGVRIGDGGSVGPGAVVQHTLTGARVVIGAGALIGGPGFGLTPGSKGLERTPQMGAVIIGDDVEIDSGANIDRGALSDTVIGARTKIDSLVQIAHNVRIGEDCVIAAQVGLSGSIVIGDRVFMGGQVGVADHLVIGDDVQIAAKSGVMKNIPAGEKWGGYPARPVKTWFKETAMMARAVRGRPAGGEIRSKRKDK